MEGRKKHDFSILIQPDLEVFVTGAPTGTSPELVEHLIDLLHEHGYPQVNLADGPDPAGMWLENRDVPILADLLGYRYETPQGRPYDVLDLSEALHPLPEDPDLPMVDLQLSEHWTKADFRICFAKCKSEEEEGYSMALKRLLNILPHKDKDYHLYRHHRPEELALFLLKNHPPHFTLVDAWTSSHGEQGLRYAQPLETRSLIASNYLLLADWLVALKMGVDPYISSLNGHALRRLGLPPAHQLLGDLTPWEDWQAPGLRLRESTAKRNESPLLRRLSRAWLYQIDTDNFPFKEILDAQVNEVLAPLFGPESQGPLARWGLLALNGLLARINQLQEGWGVLYDKDALPRQEKALGFDPNAYHPEDYEAVEDYILPLAQILRHQPPDRNGLRWRYLDGSVLFEYSRLLPVPYERFVGRVDIAQAVQLMYDNLGGARVPVLQDEQGRIIHQAERDIYLPQPNWMVLFGGSYIDVGKIECIRYAEDRQEMLWRTVESQNDSARFDDGLVRFARKPGGTEVTIVARQEFALPLFWQVVNIDYWPELKAELVSNAYSRFFSRTMANFEAVCEGRRARAGQERDRAQGEDGRLPLPPAVEQLKSLLEMGAGLLQRWKSQDQNQEGIALQVDKEGYRHFRPHDQNSSEDAIRTFLAELWEAVQKDMSWVKGER